MLTLDLPCSTRVDAGARQGGGSAPAAFPVLRNIPCGARAVPQRDSGITTPRIHPAPPHWCSSMVSSRLSTGSLVLPSLVVSPPPRVGTSASLGMGQDGARRGRTEKWKRLRTPQTSAQTHIPLRGRCCTELGHTQSLRALNKAQSPHPSLS